MNMKTYEVRYQVDGKWAVIYVQAPDSNMARRVALGELSGKAGYAGKKINVISAVERR